MAIAGIKTVTAAGTAEALGSQAINGPLMVKALLANTNNIVVGGSDVDKTTKNGVELDAGEVVIFSYVGNLNRIFIDADTNSEGVTWLALSVM